MGVGVRRVKSFDGTVLEVWNQMNRVPKVVLSAGWRMDRYDELVILAKRLAIGASEIINVASKSAFSIATKSNSNDMVTEIDKLAEQYLVSEILKVRSNDSIFGEEGANYLGTSGISWVIDPIDGTTNFIYGIPNYAVSIGIKEGETVIVGVVSNIPENVLYTGCIGGGAYKNSQPIHVRSAARFENSLIGTGFGYSSSYRRVQAQFLKELIGEVRDIRQTGAASLDLCHLAEGRLDGYFEGGLWPWDFTAAALIVREAGGVVIGAEQDDPSEEMTIAASNVKLAQFLRSKFLKSTSRMV